MKVLFFNIYNGCKERSRFERLVKYINANDPDILCLAELNGWEEKNSEKIKYLLRNTSLQYWSFLENSTGYHLGVFSRYSIQNVRKVKNNFHHGFISFSVKNINILLTHLNPFSEEERLKEISLILNEINNKGNNLLIGDLNSLSPLDKYDENRLLQKFKEIGLKKFGTKKILMDVQKKILASNLIDTMKLKTNNPGHSVPTSFNKDRAHCTKLRLDYIYASKILTPRIKDSKILRDIETEQLSDHYPLEISLL